MYLTESSTLALGCNLYFFIIVQLSLLRISTARQHSAPAMLTMPQPCACMFCVHFSSLYNSWLPWTKVTLIGTTSCTTYTLHFSEEGESVNYGPLVFAQKSLTQPYWTVIPLFKILNIFQAVTPSLFTKQNNLAWHANKITKTLKAHKLSLPAKIKNNLGTLTLHSTFEINESSPRAYKKVLILNGDQGNTKLDDI